MPGFFMTYRYQLYAFNELSNRLLYDMLALRSRIFVVEQNIVYLDLDGNDDKCLHLCLFDGDKLIGCARLVPPGLKFPEAAVGRLVLDADYRGKGLGGELMLYAVNETYKAFGDVPIIIEAQAQLQKFYESLGYEALTKPYMLEGLMHVKMRHQKENPPQKRRVFS